MNQTDSPVGLPAQYFRIVPGIISVEGKDTRGPVPANPEAAVVVDWNQETGKAVLLVADRAGATRTVKDVPPGVPQRSLPKDQHFFAVLESDSALKDEIAVLKDELATQVQSISSLIGQQAQKPRK